MDFKNYSIEQLEREIEFFENQYIKSRARKTLIKIDETQRELLFKQYFNEMQQESHIQYSIVDFLVSKNLSINIVNELIKRFKDVKDVMYTAQFNRIIFDLKYYKKTYLKNE